MMKINNCPGTLAPGFDGYSPTCLKRMFDGKKVGHVTDFKYEAGSAEFLRVLKRISISGVQEKLSAVISDGSVVLTPDGDVGRYIIKPAPSDRTLRYRQQIPANEHLTMQIARQVFGINTAECAMIFFADGEPAYITRRFDYAPDGSKLLQEDFAMLAGKTADTHGSDFKYSGSYVEAAGLIRKFVPAWLPEMTRFFTLVVFNYIFANGDAHLKNFSIRETPSGDHILSPAYDLMNTSLHIDDGDFALSGGLIPESLYSDVYVRTGHPCQDDFRTFGDLIGVLPKKIDQVIELFSRNDGAVERLIARSFLDERLKRMYLRSYDERLHRFLRTESIQTIKPGGVRSEDA